MTRSLPQERKPISREGKRNFCYSYSFIFVFLVEILLKCFLYSLLFCFFFTNNKFHSFMQLIFFRFSIMASLKNKFYVKKDDESRNIKSQINCSRHYQDSKNLFSEPLFDCASVFGYKCFRYRCTKENLII